MKVERGIIIGSDGAKMKVSSYFENVLEPALDAEWSTVDAISAQEVVEYDEYWAKEEKEEEAMLAKIAKIKK